jgi:protein-tyrosine phosphatase
MPWIQNIAAADVPIGFHVPVTENSMLIQIMDTDTTWWPEPKYKFGERHKFQFLDIEKNDHCIDPKMKISDEQAEQLVALLQRAFDKRMDVVVHCMAGVCRSGAVCEIGVMLGFQDTERFRSPNLLVKHKMMKVLGWTYDENEKPNIDDWRNFNPIV